MANQERKIMGKNEFRLKVDLGYKEFLYLIVKDADLSGANLEESVFGFMDLKGANFRNANLKKARFCDLNLEGADFRNADLRGLEIYFDRVNFNGADLRGANLVEADLRYADFYNAKLKGMEIDDGNGNVYVLEGWTDPSEDYRK